MELKNGNKRGKGGRRPGAGRKPETFHAMLEKGLSDGQVLDRVLSMAKGINGNWSEKVQLSAAMWLLEMQYGKANQSVEHKGEINMPVEIVIKTYDGNA